MDLPHGNFAFLNEPIKYFMNCLRSLRATKYCCIFFALHILNLSVDAPDVQPMSVVENLSINDQESLIEFVAEHIFGYEHAFPEADDDDNNSQSAGLYLICHPITPGFKFETNCFNLPPTKCLPPRIPVNTCPVPDGNSPPPEMLFV